MFTLAFWRAVLERAVKTCAQSLAALLVADGTDLLTTDWGGRLSVAGMASVVSVLTSLASSQLGDAGPSLAGETLTEVVAAKVEPASPTGLVAGPVAVGVEIPPGEPVHVIDASHGRDEAVEGVGE